MNLPAHETLLARLFYWGEIGMRDLRFRWTLTSLCVLFGALSVIAVVLSSYYGATFYAYHQRVIEDSLPLRLEVITSLERPFTRESVARWGRHPDVRTAFEQIETRVKLSLGDGTPPLLVNMEASTPDDPAMGRFLWGRSFQAEGESEIVLPASLLTHKLRGRRGPGGEPIPDRLVIEVVRTQGGEEEVSRMPVRIAGLTDRAQDQIFAPLPLAIAHDRWLSHKTETAPGASEASIVREVAFPELIAWGAFDQLPRAEAAAERAGLELQVHEPCVVYLTEPPQVPVWSLLEGTAAEPWREATSHPAQWYQWNNDGARRTLLALPADDPRWGAEFGPPPLGTVLRRNSRAPSRFPLPWGEISTDRESSLPGVPEADYHTTLDTLRRLNFNPQRTGEIVTLAVTADSQRAARWAAEFPNQVAAASPNFWQVRSITPPRDQASEEPQLETTSPVVLRRDAVERAARELAASFPRLRTALIEEQAAELQEAPRQRAVGVKRPVVLRRLPGELFQAMLGPSVPSGNGGIPCVVVQPPRREWEWRELRYAGRPLDVRRVLEGARAELWLSAVADNGIRLSAAPAETGAPLLAIWGDWLEEAEADEFLRRGLSPDRPLHSGRPSHFWLRSALAPEELARRDPHRGAGMRMERIQQLPLEVRARSGEELGRVAWNVHGRGVPSGIARVGGAEPFAREALLRTGTTTQPLTVEYDPELPPGVALLNYALFRELAFELADARGEVSLPGESLHTLHCEHVHAFLRERERAERQGARLQPITPVQQEKWRRYTLRRRDGGPCDQHLLVSLNINARPAFEVVAGRLELNAELSGCEMLLTGSIGEHDPAQFAAPLAAGRWLQAGAGEICLAEHAAASLFPELPASEMVGKTVRLRLERARRAHVAEPAFVLPLKIVGISTGSENVVGMEELQSWIQWREGKLFWDERRGLFQTPGEVYEEQGHLRLAVDPVSEGAAWRLVEEFRAAGYDVQHDLGKMLWLRGLGQAVALMVGIFVVIPLLLAAALVCEVCATSIYMRQYEIGVLKAHGVRGWEIVAIYLGEGLAIGLGALVVGTLGGVLGEPLLRLLLVRAFNLTADCFPLPVYAPQMLWVFLVAGGVVLLVNVLGCAGPAWWFARQTPVRLLSTR